MGTLGASLNGLAVTCCCLLHLSRGIVHVAQYTQCSVWQFAHHLSNLQEVGWIDKGCCTQMCHALFCTCPLEIMVDMRNQVVTHLGDQQMHFIVLLFNHGCTIQLESIFMYISPDVIFNNETEGDGAQQLVDRGCMVP